MWLFFRTKYGRKWQKAANVAGFSYKVWSEVAESSECGCFFVQSMVGGGRKQRMWLFFRTKYGRKWQKAANVAVFSYKVVMVLSMS